MPSSDKFCDRVIGQFKDSGLKVTTRKMMGEYILYADGKIFGGLYDDRLLVKPVDAAKNLMPEAELQSPYSGAKQMLRVTDELIDDDEFLVNLVRAMLPELPKLAKKRRR